MASTVTHEVATNATATMSSDAPDRERVREGKSDRKRPDGWAAHLVARSLTRSPRRHEMGRDAPDHGRSVPVLGADLERPPEGLHTIGHPLKAGSRLRGSRVEPVPIVGDLERELIRTRRQTNVGVCRMRNTEPILTELKESFPDARGDPTP